MHESLIGEKCARRHALRAGPAWPDRRWIETHVWSQPFDGVVFAGCDTRSIPRWSWRRRAAIGGWQRWSCSGRWRRDHVAAIQKNSSDRPPSFAPRPVTATTGRRTGASS